MKVELPELEYKYDSLEPHLDGLTMEIHHSKHHQGYTNKYNAAIESHPELEGETPEGLLRNPDAIPQEIRSAVRNNGGGYVNHKWFWKMLSPNGGGEPTGELAEKITKTFGSFEKFQAAFEKAGLSQFGSGWVWLILDKNELKLMTTPNQDNPITAGYEVLLGVDVWEHAYYKKFSQDRAGYLKAIWNVINWKYVEERYNKYKA